MNINSKWWEYCIFKRDKGGNHKNESICTTKISRASFKCMQLYFVLTFHPQEVFIPSVRAWRKKFNISLIHNYDLQKYQHPVLSAMRDTNRKMNNTVFQFSGIYSRLSVSSFAYLPPTSFTPRDFIISPLTTNIFFFFNLARKSVDLR